MQEVCNLADTGTGIGYYLLIVGAFAVAALYLYYKSHDGKVFALRNFCIAIVAVLLLGPLVSTASTFAATQESCETVNGASGQSGSNIQLPTDESDEDDDSSNPVVQAVVAGQRCNIFLNGAGTWEGQADQNWTDLDLIHITPEKPDSPNRNFWKYDGPHDFAYDPDSVSDQAVYDGLVQYISDQLDDRDCGPTFIAGGSNGGAFAAKMYCDGQDFGGRAWGYHIDDPVMDNGVLGCDPSPNIQTVMFTHSQEMQEDAAGAVDSRCSNIMWQWYCEDDTTMTVEDYQTTTGQTSYLQRRYHSNNDVFSYSEYTFWENIGGWWCDWNQANRPGDLPAACD